MRIKKAITFLVFFSFLIILIAVLSPQFYAKALGNEKPEKTSLETESLDLFEEANTALNQDPERAAPPLVTDDLEMLAAWGGPIGGVALRDNLAYVSTGQRFVVLDVTDTENPVEVGMLHYEEPIKDIIVRGDYAYVISKSPVGNQFSVIDISNSEEPEIVWNSQHIVLPTLCSTNSRVWPEEIALYEDLAYIIVGPELFVFDITHPTGVQFMNRVPNRVSGHCDFMNEITVKDDLMYIVGGGIDPSNQKYASFFWIYDLSKDPQNPGLIGEIAYHDIVRDFDRIEVAENYAYLTGERNALQDINQLFTIDISDPALPTTRSVMNISRNVHGLAASDSGDYLYFTTQESIIPKLEIYNVSDPSNPTFVSEYGYQRGGKMRDITSSGSRLYIVHDTEGIVILDVLDPFEPTQIGKYYSPPDLGTVVKQGNLAYVLDRWNGFVVLDLGNHRETPKVVGKYQISENMSSIHFGRSVGYRGMALKNEKVYLAADKVGIEIVDISDPANPVLEQTINDLPCFTSSATAVESLALAEVNGRDILSVGCGYGNFMTFDVTNPSNVQTLAQITAFFRSLDKMEIHKDGERTLVFIVANVRFTGSPLIIVDISDPENPEVIYTGPSGIAMSDISIKDNLLYFPGTESFSGPWDVFIQNISNPVEPVTLSRFRATTASNVAFYPVASAGDHVFGDRLYGTGVHYFPPTPNFPQGIYTMALKVYDVTDPTQPQELDALQISREHDVGDYADLVVDGSFLYFTQYKPGRDRDSPGQATGLTIYRR